ncbi:MAG: hypothetical protein ABIA04_14725 [Pseudomonadota bacterium]
MIFNATVKILSDGVWAVTFLGMPEKTIIVTEPETWIRSYKKMPPDKQYLVRPINGSLEDLIIEIAAGKLRDIFHGFRRSSRESLRGGDPINYLGLILGPFGETIDFVEIPYFQNEWLYKGSEEVAWNTVKGMLDRKSNFLQNTILIARTDTRYELEQGLYVSGGNFHIYESHIYSVVVDLSLERPILISDPHHPELLIKMTISEFCYYFEQIGMAKIAFEPIYEIPKAHQIF